MEHFLAAFCFLTTFAAFEAAKSMGPVGNIIANSVFPCKENPTNGDIALYAELKTIDDKGAKAMYGNMTNKIALDNTIDYTLDIQKWEGGGWKNYYNVKGVFCVDAQKLFPKVWQKLRSETKPAITLPCPVKPGNYILDKFQVTSKDLTIPAIFYGRFLVKFRAYKTKKLLICLQGEGVSQAP